MTHRRRRWTVLSYLCCHCLMLGTEVDLKQVENSVFTMEMVLKAWLQEQGGDREHLHLLLPNPLDNPIPVCVKCDMQERLISPALIPLNPNLGVKTGEHPGLSACH
ncbi:Meiosis 1 arrest protein [Larimichthys crocea]|uniref:Uncharacterized protein n=1 Tax=Larimichthys crocea TaxID=215358 RepID=A0ACD3Q5T1_LARCR|nr:Meiosis 1 arrest protein [Larimichthys crocea]